MTATPDSEAIIAALRALKPRLRDEMGITRLRVFGSVARGEAGPDSDVDLIADFEETPGLFKLSGVRFFLEDHLHRKVDLMRPQGIHKALKDIILSEATDV